MKLELTALARRDLLQIASHGARRFGLAASRAYKERIGRALKAIQHMPELARVQPGISAPVRIHPVGSHVILYMLTNNGIQVLRVLHGHQNWIEHL